MASARIPATGGPVHQVCSGTPRPDSPLIVIAEGEDSLPFSAQETLCRSGHSATTTTDVLEAVRHAECGRRGILIACLPVDCACSGLDVVHMIRRRARTLPLVMIPADSSEALAIAALRAGATDYLPPPIGLEDLLNSVRRCLEAHTPDRSDESAARRSSGPEPPRMVGESRSIRSILASIAKAASTESTVLITGETGTGKELAAELIHYHSARRAKPLVRINCAAIPDTLLESELFGYERGAFTGAHAAFEGKLQRADGGTVFFDEIGDMTPYAQAKLLRVIETGEADRLGGTRSRRLNIRIVAATNLELEPLLAQNRFRKDLYFRLNVVRIHLPPLRERREDVRPLIEHYLALLNARMETRVSGIAAGALEAALRYDWPGNVRELKNVLEAVMVGHPYGMITPAGLPQYLRASVAMGAPGDAGTTVDSTERDRVLSALFETNWNKCKAAKQLRWSRMTLYRKMAKYHIRSA
jgi:DNA-binding NtrC family response regulator